MIATKSVPWVSMEVPTCVVSPVGVRNTFPTLVWPVSVKAAEGSWPPRECLNCCGLQAWSPAAVRASWTVDTKVFLTVGLRLRLAGRRQREMRIRDVL